MASSFKNPITTDARARLMDLDWASLLYRLAAVTVGVAFILLDPAASFFGVGGRAGISRIPSLIVLLLFALTGTIAARRRSLTLFRRPLREVILALELVLVGVLVRVTSQQDSIFHLYFPLVLGWSTRGLTLRQGLVAGAIAAAISITVGSGHADSGALIYSAFLLPLFGAVSAGQQGGAFAEAFSQLQRALEARTRLRGLERTHSAVKAMAPLSLEARIRRFLHEAVDLVEADIAVAALFDEEGGLRVKAVHNLDPRDWLDRELPSVHGVTARMLTDGASPPRGDATPDPAWQEVLGGFEGRSVVAVPLRVQERMVGLALIACRHEKELRPVDVESLTLLADEAAVVLHDAQVQQKLHDLLTGSVQALTYAMEFKDPYTRGHSQRVGTLAAAIAMELGLPADEVEDVRLAGLLHDIGKIGTPEAILHNPGPLSLEERFVGERYPIRGATILASLRPLRPLVDLVLYHQESFDGSGYPEGRVGHKIPLGARIIRVADAFDGLTTARPFRSALTPQEAFDVLWEGAGTEWDPHLVELLHRIMTEAAEGTRSVQAQQPAASGNPGSTAEVSEHGA